MLPTPKKYFVTAASAEGNSELTAFDKALLKARIGNVNLLRVSSILPPGCEYDPNLTIPAGSLVPTAYGYIVSDQPGMRISAAVGVGLAPDAFGVIMEYSGICGASEAEQTITRMVEEAFAIREMQLLDIKIASVEHVVEKIGCAYAAVPMWY
ncbi:MAG: arginine decarboxylase, pyruvoyl-dependent [Peptococcaceae bacterium]|nr:arginine decarboxylase, pyruvoyl-dependent [Peptococcaceae bacterium]